MYAWLKIERFDGSIFSQKIEVTSDIIKYKIINGGVIFFMDFKKLEDLYFGKDYKIVDLWLD